MTSSKFFKISAAVATALSITACIPGGGGGDSEGGAFGLVLTNVTPSAASVVDGGSVTLSWSGNTLGESLPLSDYTMTIFANTAMSSTGGVAVATAACTAINLSGGTNSCALTPQFIGDDISYSTTGSLTCTTDNVAGTVDCGVGTIVNADVSALLAASATNSLYFIGQINAGTAVSAVTPVAFTAVTPTTISDVGGAADAGGANFDIAATGSQVTQGVTSTKVEIALGSVADLAANTSAAGTEEFRWQLLFDTNGNGTVEAGEKAVALVHASTGTPGNVAMANMTAQVESGGVAAVGAVTSSVDNVNNVLTLLTATAGLGLAGTETPVILTNDAVTPVSDSSL